MITRLTGKNQVTVPAEIVAKAGLKKGSRLDWRPTGRKDVLEVHILPDRAAIVERLQGFGARFRKEGEEDPIAQLIREREEEDRTLNGEL